MRFWQAFRRCVTVELVERKGRYKMSWYIKAIKNYVNFSGRARRREYWTFIIVNAVLGFILIILDSVLNHYIANDIRILSGIYGLFVFIPGLSVSFRRLHDINKPAWWLLIGAIPLVGWIWLFVYSIKDGTIGPNKYGYDPKAI